MGGPRPAPAAGEDDTEVEETQTTEAIGGNGGADRDATGKGAAARGAAQVGVASVAPADAAAGKAVAPTEEAADRSARAASPARVWHVWGVAFDARIVQIVTLATLILIVAFNNRFVAGEYDRFVLEFIIPVAWIVLVWRESPRAYGFGIGDWRLGLPIVAGGVAVMAVIIWFAGQQPDFRAYYTDSIDGRPMWRLVIDTGIDLLAWEFFFRGWLLWGLGRKYGTDAIWLQVIPFALMHVWKPEIEQLSTVVGGAFFGLLAWRTRSFVYGWLLHWFMLAWVLMVTAGYV
jgi:membrane protease YdiL (CAAX protease family)